MPVTTQSRSSPVSAQDTSSGPTSGRSVLGLSVAQVLGGALAAATSALAASFLGVAGTLVGAVVGSVVATVGAAVYAHSLRKAATSCVSSGRRSGQLPHWPVKTVRKSTRSRVTATIRSGWGLGCRCGRGRAGDGGCA